MLPGHKQHEMQRCDGLLVSSKAVRSLYLLYSKVTDFKKSVCPCLRTIMKVNAQVPYTSHCIVHREGKSIGMKVAFSD